MAASVIIAVIIFISGGRPGKDPQAAEAEFLGQLRLVLDDCARVGEDISPTQLKELKTKAENLKLADRGDELISYRELSFKHAK